MLRAVNSNARPPAIRVTWALLAAILLWAPSANAMNDEFIWARAIGGEGISISTAIAVDNEGNTYTTGVIYGPTDFDPGPDTFELTTTGSSNVFVSKLDRDGNFVWARTMAGENNSFGFAIAVDLEGHVYTTGNFFGTVDFDPGPNTFELTATGIASKFVSKLDGNGDFVWARSMGGTFNVVGRGIALDNEGNVYITGSYSGTADLDPGPGIANFTSAASEEHFVSKLDRDGDLVWARAMVGSAENSGWAIAVDDEGSAYTTGRFSGTVDFDPGPGNFLLESGGGSDIFVSKLNSDGSFAWARSAPGVGFGNIGRGIALDSEGNAYATGHFMDTAIFRPGPDSIELTVAGADDVFVWKLDGDGESVWARSVGGSSPDRARAIAVDDAGYVYITGSFSGTADLDPGPDAFEVTAVEESDAFVSKLDSDGNFVWARVISGTGDNEGVGIALDSSFNVYATGFFQDTVDFDPVPGLYTLTAESIRNFFVLKLRDEKEPPLCIPGDVNCDSFINAIDVQLVINAALGIAIDPAFNADINRDGPVNAVDVQLVINAALGIDIAGSF